MNKQELHEAFSTIHASEDLMKEVLSVEMENRKRVNGWVLARRAVACAAVLALLIGALLFWPGQTKTEDGEIIAAPGILKVYAHETETAAGDNVPKQYELPGNERFLVAIWNPLISASNFGQSLEFEIPKDYFGTTEVTFKISSDEEGLCKETILNNGDEFKFDLSSIEYHSAMLNRLGKEDSFYLDIIIYADEKIAGYGVISF